MSLLTDAMEDCVMLDRRTQPDGYGGFESVWVDGAGFSAAVIYDSSTQARIGAVQGLTSLYTVTTERSVILQNHDVFRRVSDGKVLRVTSDGADKKTPRTAGLDMRQVSAEEWRLPNG